MVRIINGDMQPEEVQEYRRYIQEHKPGYRLEAIRIDGPDVVLECAPVPFVRIRRITGYLVGTLDSFNDAKRAEERDRVKHG